MIFRAKSNAPQTFSRERIRLLSESLCSRLFGQEEAVEGALITMLAGGHLLLEGPPGVGKTSLAQALANLFQGGFRRVQMTSDLLPSDILGTLRLRAGGGEFEFRPGPIFTNVLLADELNRTSAKTQAALLEAMGEGKVTVDGVSYPLPVPFFVVATQNPQEFHGVYPLSESQLDRFMMLVSLNIPVAEEELSVYRKHANAEAVRLSAASSLSSSELLEYRAEVGKVFVEESLLRYSQEIAQKLRTTDDVVHAASVRSMLQLIDAAKARAFLFDREFVLPEDISKLAPDILGHRLCFRSGEVSSLQRKEIVRDAVDRVDPPR